MSEIAKEKHNWLNEVKEEAERLTRERLAVELPKLKAQAEERAAAKRETTDHSVASFDGAVPQPPQPEPVAKKGSKK